MTTLTIGELVIDLDRVSDEAVVALERFAVDGELTDDVLAAFAEWKANGGGSSTGSDGESKASKMRRMAAAGMKTGDIAKALGVRFQFVYNVLSKESKKGA